jgi:hypothetical protein
MNGVEFWNRFRHPVQNYTRPVAATVVADDDLEIADVRHRTQVSNPIKNNGFDGIAFVISGRSKRQRIYASCAVILLY